MRSNERFQIMAESTHADVRPIRNSNRPTPTLETAGAIVSNKFSRRQMLKTSRCSGTSARRKSAVSGGRIHRDMACMGRNSRPRLLDDPEGSCQRHIGVTGNSGGGTMTTWLCGLDTHWTMAAPSCFVTTFRRNLENELPADTEQCPPRAIALGLDHEDFIAGMAPKPVIQALVYRLGREPLAARPSGKPSRAVLYVAHHSSDSELRTQPLVLQLFSEEPEAAFYTCDVAESELYSWPLSCFVPGVLSRFDLPDCYFHLKLKNLRQIDPSHA